MKSKRNSTSFKIGHKRSPESIEKQRRTMREQFRRGEREPPSPEWTEERIKQRTASMRETRLIKNPIGSRRKHRSGHKEYWVIRTSDRGKWPYEHRVVMERKLGRKLLTKEHVHHINGDTLDNRQSNLELLTHSSHSRYHGLKRTMPDNRLKKGKWSRKYDFCIVCETDRAKHVSKGRCNNCYSKLYRRGEHLNPPI